MSASEPQIPPDQAIERAADILERESEPVVRGIFQLLVAGGGQTAWQDGHTQAALKILTTHVENEHKTRCLKIEAAERAASLKQKPLLLGIAIVGVIAVSFLFLQFNRPEFIVAVFTAAGGFAAGYGTANHRVKKQ